MAKKYFDRLSACLTGIYALLLITFGIIGFVKSGSHISLYSGGGLGILLLGCSIGMMKGVRFCLFGALGILVILMAAFFFRSIATFKPVPIVFGILSLSLFLLISYRAAYRRK